MVDTPLRALVADDEEPAREELVYLLSQDPRIGAIQTASDGPEALKILQASDLDVVFCDIKMPGLDGIDLASVLSKFRQPRPRIVFVTAYDEHAVAAFELDAADYVMKPVRAERLAEAVRRVVTAGAPAALQSPDDTDDETISVELAGITRFVQRSTVRYVEAQGDYARLHTGQNSHLVRIPLSTLEERWRDAGFTRIHRSTLVALAHIDEMRVDGGRCAVRVGGDWLPVSRRHTRELRDLLVRSTSLR
ncbi:LytTR family two component transcriptional regulator [Kribbella rubisoli]|uniref:LytTR family two component transcriptional regulator n=1 Tax=Kribbella rubisoli TaxID=3075929 RepID=A0A4Q7WUV9_9ACTN|nr:LytTR family DNA-binding domain-containing protein [Kribbella rubisoli]RZU13803.1 LytTR family two component transcriptional regulator [Kribbella rubisoli]